MASVWYPGWGGRMSELEGGGGGRGRKTREDPWMVTVTSVSAFLAGFSLAAVVVIADAPEHFRWPGVAELALTIGSVVLVVAAQASRNGAYYYEDYRKKWRHWIWVAYHGGIIALLVGLGAALAPLEGVADKPGVAGQQGLRWAAASVAFAIALGEAVDVVRTLVQRHTSHRLKNDNYKKLADLLGCRKGWQEVMQDDEPSWCHGAVPEARLVITPAKDRFLMYLADPDKSWVMPSIESVKTWLDEHQHAGLPPLQEEYKRALEQQEPGSADG